MSRRKAPSYVEIRCPDGMTIQLEHPGEELLRAILQVIGSNARPDTTKRRPRLVDATGDAGNPL
jgi:hypothetical protein